MQRARHWIVFGLPFALAVFGCATFPYYSEQQKKVETGSNAMMNCWGAVMYPKDGFMGVDMKDGTVWYWIFDPNREVMFVTCVSTWYPTVSLRRDARGLGGR